MLTRQAIDATEETGRSARRAAADLLAGMALACSALVLMWTATSAADVEATPAATPSPTPPPTGIATVNLVKIPADATPNEPFRVHFIGNVENMPDPAGSLLQSVRALNTPDVVSATVTTGPDFHVTDIGCDDILSPVPSTWDVATGTVSFNVDPGEHVTCDVTVEQLAFFAVKTTVLPEGSDQGQFLYEYVDRGRSRAAITLNATQQLSDRMNPALPGFGTLSMRVTEGWVVTGIDCDDSKGDSPGSVDVANATAELNLESGERVTCEFTVAREGELSVAVAADEPGPDVALGFEVTNTRRVPTGAAGTYATGSVTVGETWDVGRVDLGDHFIDVVSQPGDPWRISGVTCSGTEAQSVGIAQDAIALVTIGPGEHATCRFVLTRTEAMATVAIEKVPPGADGEFEVQFTPEGGSPVTIPMDPAASRPTQSFDADTGDATATISVDPAWRVTRITCDDNPSSDTPSTGNVEAMRIDFGVDPGEHVTCTVRAELLGYVAVTITTRPDDAGPDQFIVEYIEDGDSRPLTVGLGGTSGPESESLPGQHTARLHAVEGWVPESIECSDAGGPSPSVGSLITRSVAVDLDPGEHLACTFEVARTGELSIAVVGETPDIDHAVGFEVLAVAGSDEPAGAIRFLPGTVRAGSSWSLGMVPPSRYIISPVSGLEPPWKVVDKRCSGTDEAPVAGEDIIPNVKPASKVICAFEISDRIIPKEGRWRSVNTRSSGCTPLDLQNVGPSNGRVSVRQGGKRLVVTAPGGRIVLNATDAKNVYTGKSGPFSYRWVVMSEEQMRGTASFKRGGCSISRTYRITYLGK